MIGIRQTYDCLSFSLGQAVSTSTPLTAVTYGRATPVWGSRMSSGPERRRLAVHVKGSRFTAKVSATVYNVEQSRTSFHVCTCAPNWRNLRWPINFDPVPECRD